MSDVTDHPEHHEHRVRIHIDRQVYESLNPTTGRDLYELAGIGPHRELFKERTGDHEDEPVDRDDAHLHLHEDDHFYSEKEVDLIVNGQVKRWLPTTISYEQVTHLAFPAPPPPGIVITFTVEYEDGPRKNPEGSMSAGKSVNVKNRMIFHVTETGRS